MSSLGPASTVLHLPDEVAVMLRCSKWWVEEQARKRRIPYCRIGGGYRFTDEHIAEIIRRFEVRPDESSMWVPEPRRPVRPVSAELGGSVVQLKARIPRRTRTTGVRQAA